MKEYTTYTADEYINNNMYDEANEIICRACRCLYCQPEDLVILHQDDVDDELAPLFKWNLTDDEVECETPHEKWGVLSAPYGAYLVYVNQGGTTLFMTQRVFNGKVKTLNGEA